MIHYRENIYSLDNYERYITDSSLFENTGDGIIYTGIVPLITVVEPVVSNQHSVLIIPGGGYRRIVYEREGLDVGRWIAGQGYTAFILSYRMPSVNGYYSFADAKNALNFISYWAGMSERTFKSVGCMGFSAGGHLAGYITHLHYEEETSVRPDWMALIYPVILANLRAISHDGIKLRPGDRCVSWLPFYHDMGLVGFLLTPVATQLSVDYLRTQDFAMRPLQWLKLISKNRGTVSVAPPFGYELCQRRVNEKDLAELDLSCWRVAGIGAEPISAEQLHQFAECFRQVNFDDKTFMPCYGLAENALAVSFSDEASGVVVNEVDRDILEYQGKAVAPGAETRAVSTFVNCGKALPEHGIEIRNEAGMPVAERVVGHICISGPSLMSGYFGDQVSQDEIAATGWLDTGDLGYLLDGYLYVTGRIKDLIIIRGRNIWPQDIEYIAEQEPEIHSGDAIAFVTVQEKIILQIQCRISDEERRGQLIHALAARIQSEFGVTAAIDLLPPHSIPRTSSGKPARA